MSNFISILRLTLTHKMLIDNVVYNKNTQAWILASDTGQYPAKNRVMSDESCFTTETVVRREVEKKKISFQCLKTQKHSVSIGLCTVFSFNEHFHKQLINAVFLCVQNRKICFSKNILYQQLFVASLPCLEQFLLRKHFICHYITLREKHKRKSG